MEILFVLLNLYLLLACKAFWALVTGTCWAVMTISSGWFREEYYDIGQVDC